MRTAPRPASGSAGNERPDLVAPDHGQIIGESFYVYTRVRTLVLAAIVAAALFGRHVLRMQALDVRAFVALAAGMALYNAAAWTYFRRYRHPEAPPQVFPRLLAVTYAAVVLDFLALTSAVWLVGGARSPFTAFYLLHVSVSCILLSHRAALVLTALAWALLAALVAVEWSGLALPPLPAGAVAGTGPLGGRYALTLIVVHGALFWLNALLLLALTRSLRSGEQRIRLANAELSRLSQQRRDFLHIAGHNLRAPLGAVTMLLENMRSGLAGETTEKQRDWLDRSLRRLGDMGDFMAGIQTLASLETDIIQTQFGRVRLPEVAARLVEEYADVAASRRHSLSLEVRGPVPAVVGHERLLKEALVNYVTNAIKFTPEGGHIVVRVLHRPPSVRVEVRDDGIGIEAQAQERLFQEFVRIDPAPEAAKVKGSGLGLSIVKRIALAHGGRAWVESTPGEGSTFGLELPAVQE
jgi:signal transduction histidine kinase